MLYIDDKPVPFDALTGEPLTNIQLVNGQWVLVPKIGKDVMPEYRVIPQALLSGAVLFEDAATKKKVGYIDANKLADYLENKQVPKGAGFEQFKKDIAKATGEIRREWKPEYNMENNEIPQFLKSILGFNYFERASSLIKTMVSKIEIDSTRIWRCNSRILLC